MKRYRCAVIEDEPIGAKMLLAMLEQAAPDLEVVHVGKTLEEAIKAFTDRTIDLYFTDIELLDGNVFDVLKNVSFQPNQFIVFTTAYEEFGAKAFSFPALHYLLKPINPNELDKAIARFRESVAKTDGEQAAVTGVNGKNGLSIDKLLVPTQNGTIFIDFDQVIRVQSSNKFSIVITADKKQHIVSKPLTRFEEVLEKHGFLRVHDSHLVNVKHIVRYVKSGKAGDIVMTDDSKVPVSPRRKEVIAALFKDVL